MLRFAFYLEEANVAIRRTCAGRIGVGVVDMAERIWDFGSSDLADRIQTEIDDHD